jgi:hypothetical protein
MDEKPIGSIAFIDGIARPAFLDVCDRRYILDDEGNPEIVNRPGSSAP